MPVFFSANTLHLVYAATFFIVGYFLAGRLGRLAEIPVQRRFSPHHAQLTRRAVYYITLTVFIIIGLQHLGFNLTVLLGAAGVFTVAISFASQTAVSNLISGIFLLFKCPFKVGDSIRVQGISGVVESIDLLSSKLRTQDNTLVRIPNETLIKSDITNLSYFTTRRLELTVTVAGDTLLTVAKACLLSVADQTPVVLKKPAPFAFVEGFSETGITLKLHAWIQTENATLARSLLQETLKIAFEEKNIEIEYLTVLRNRTQT